MDDAGISKQDVRALLFEVHDQRAVIADLLAALEGLLEAFSLGPLGSAAKYGPECDVREIEIAAVDAATAAVAKARS